MGSLGLTCDQVKINFPVGFYVTVKSQWSIKKNGSLGAILFQKVFRSSSTTNTEQFSLISCFHVRSVRRPLQQTMAHVMWAGFFYP
jgi:hypothetical protein